MNRRDRRARGERGKVVEVEPVSFAVDFARMRGCTCDPPGLDFSGPIRYGELAYVQVAHDAGCPLMANGTQATMIEFRRPK